MAEPTVRSEKRTADFTVRPVKSRRDFRRFVAFPYPFYKDFPYWVPPLRQDVKKTLNPQKNAFFEHGHLQSFLAEDADGNVLGRIAAIYNGMHLKKYDDDTGFFGFFECVERYEVAEALFDAARMWLQAENLTSMHGPANPSLNDIAGFLVDGFDRLPSLMMPYNKPYYEDFLTRYGFTRAMTMWAYYVHDKILKTDKLKRGVEIVKRRYPGLSVRNPDLNFLPREEKILLEIYNEAWSGNWGHVPMTDAEFKQLVKELMQIIEPELIFILEDEGYPVAFAVSLPNLNHALRHVRDGRLLPLGLPKLLAYSKFGGIRDIRMVMMGVRTDYRGKGLDAILIWETIVEGRSQGYEACEMSWILDNNTVLKNAIHSLGGIVDKEYALFKKVF